MREFPTHHSYSGMRYAPRIDTAMLALLAGGVIAYPTEGVYGLGCLPGDADAIHRLLHIKHRSWRKGLALVAGSVEQLEQLVVFPKGGFADEIEASWPGPVTWILPAQPGIPRLITGGRRTLAVRVTDHVLTKALCMRIGSALVSTSANRSRSAPLRTALSVRRALGAELDYVLAGPLGGLTGPTPIRDGATGAYLRGA